MYILYTLFDAIVEPFTDNLQPIMQTFARTLNDPESLEVRSTTVL